MSDESKKLDLNAGDLERKIAVDADLLAEYTRSLGWDSRKRAAALACAYAAEAVNAGVPKMNALRVVETFYDTLAEGMRIKKSKTS